MTRITFRLGSALFNRILICALSICGSVFFNRPKRQLNIELYTAFDGGGCLLVFIGEEVSGTELNRLSKEFDGSNQDVIEVVWSYCCCCYRPDLPTRLVVRLVFSHVSFRIDSLLALPALMLLLFTAYSLVSCAILARHRASPAPGSSTLRILCWPWCCVPCVCVCGCNLLSIWFLPRHSVPLTRARNARLLEKAPC